MVLILAVFVCSFGIYTSNGQNMGSFDSAPNSVLALSVLRYHTLNLDEFRGSYFKDIGGAYAFIEAPNGHLTSLFPIGTALLTAPAYALIYAADGPLPITSPSFEQRRRQYEKTIAALLAALSAALFFLCARMLGNAVQALAATVVFVLGTSLWTIGSQALWQHGPVNFCVLAMVYALLRADRAQTTRSVVPLLAVAGLLMGLLPVVRPTAAIFSVGGMAFTFWRFRAGAWPIVPAMAAGILPGILWNEYFFHTLVGGYDVNATAFTHAPLAAAVALVGLLVSPSRGLFVFSPVLLFSVAGFYRSMQSRDWSARLLLLLGAGGAALVVFYAFFEYWWGGFTYGPRYLTDIAAICCLLLVPVIPKRPTFSAATVAFLLAFAFSAGVQAVGANSGAAGSDWNAVPLSVDVDPSRLWDLADNQIERNARAAYYKNIAWKTTLVPGYASGLRTSVTAIALPREAKAGSLMRATATLHNDGPSRAYGYDSGVYLGQLRLAVFIRDTANHVQSTQYLFCKGSPRPGEDSQALGGLAAPAQPGNYTVEVQPIALGLGPIAGPATSKQTLKVKS